MRTPFQFEFCKNFSTQDALIYVTQNIQKETNSWKIIFAALLDLSKAFDTISQKKICQKIYTLLDLQWKQNLKISSRSAFKN